MDLSIPYTQFRALFLFLNACMSMQHRFKSKLDTPNHVCAGLFKPRLQALLLRPSLHPEMADTNPIQNADQVYGPLQSKNMAHVCVSCHNTITPEEYDVAKGGVFYPCTHVMHWECLDKHDWQAHGHVCPYCNVQVDNLTVYPFTSPFRVWVKQCLENARKPRIYVTPHE